MNSMKFTLAAGLLCSLADASLSIVRAGAIDGLLPHRAVYDLALAKSSDRSGITGMNGRIVYEMTGSKCEGFSVRFRFLTEVQTARKSFTNDQRTTSFESSDGRSFSFVNQSYLNGQLEQELRGRAERSGNMTSVKITKPKPFSAELDASIFMTEHIALLVEAAQRQQTFVTAKVFDGSENGDELVDTTAVIGRRRDEMVNIEGEPDSVSQLFKGQGAWPISVSYFSVPAKPGKGERFPIYQVSFIMHENGVSRDLKMQYEDYSLKGDLKKFEFLKTDNCS
jgi:hypothetical protein